MTCCCLPASTRGARSNASRSTSPRCRPMPPKMPGAVDPSRTVSVRIAGVVPDHRRRGTPSPAFRQPRLERPRLHACWQPPRDRRRQPAVRQTALARQARITVVDHGPGIPPETAPHVFERFWRSDPARVRAQGGAGLGLSIVAAIADAHGGRVSFTQTPGGGATFASTFRPNPTQMGRSSGVRRAFL